MAQLLSVSLLILSLGLPTVVASQKTRCAGWITDEACGAKGANAAHKDCAVKCLEKGSKLCLYCLTDKKIYKLDKQDLAKQHIGHEVVITGEMRGDSIAVSSIEMSKDQ